MATDPRQESASHGDFLATGDALEAAPARNAPSLTLFRPALGNFPTRAPQEVSGVGLPAAAEALCGLPLALRWLQPSQPAVRGAFSEAIGPLFAAA
ncbi:hypothetical protein [Luteimonas cucumeris]|uniref:hypothetical protein n=1 Tax=Luteimonas cucumeris TaxID=985012 RepID=UPI0011A4C0CA|nr:hypothetical protein [Luteimonas cucumeris]